MMIPINPEAQMVVDRSSYAEIVGAQSADLDANQATVKRRNLDGTEETVTLYYPGGITIVRRR